MSRSHDGNAAAVPQRGQPFERDHEARLHDVVDTAAFDQP